MYAEEIRRQAEAAPRAALPAVTALLWRAYGEGKVTEVEAEALSALIEARREAGGRSPAGQSPNPRGTEAPAVTDPAQGRQNGPRKPGAGARPRTDASLERRRRWAASGRLPPGLAARFTLAEQAVLALVAAETVRRKDCRLAVPHLAAIAGVAETTVRNAIREAKRIGLLTVEERRVTGFRNLPNVVRIVSPEWVSWLRLTRRSTTPPAGPTSRRPPAEGGGCKSANRTPTQVLESGKTRPAAPWKEASGRRKAGPMSPDRGRSDSRQAARRGG